jgi:ATP-binding cassette subfamily F protein 3
MKRQQAEIARTEEFIRKNIAGQGTNQAKSRRKMLDKIERLELGRDMWADAGRIGLRFEVGERPGAKDAIVAERLAVGYPGAAPLLEGLDLTIYRGERVGIIGDNGSGKSTLLKTLLGKLPVRGGQVRQAGDLRVAYFDQKLGDLRDDRSLIDEIRSVRGDMAADQTRTYLARFRFFGDDALRVVKGLSGGERNRLTLAKMMLRPANLLAMDEPTNHLDIPAREVLERALRRYEGTLLVISHDRFFLDEVCTRLVVLEGGKVSLENGNYSDWRRRVHARAKQAVAPPPARKKEPTVPPPPQRDRDFEGPREAVPSGGRAASGTRASDFESSKQLKAARAKKERRLAQLEGEIASLEARTAELRSQLAGEHGGNWQSLHALVEEERELADKLTARLAEWEKLGAELG